MWGTRGEIMPIIIITVIAVVVYVIYRKFNPKNVQHAVYDVNEIPVYNSTRTGPVRNNENGDSGDKESGNDTASGSSGKSYSSFNNATLEINGFVVRDAEPKQVSAAQLLRNKEAENSSEYWAEVARREAAAAARADQTRGTVGIPATETGNLISYAQKEFNFEGVETDMFTGNQIHPFEDTSSYKSDSPEGGWSDADSFAGTVVLPENHSMVEEENKKEPETPVYTMEERTANKAEDMAKKAKKKLGNLKDSILIGVFKKNEVNFGVDVNTEGTIIRKPFVLKKPLSILAVSDNPDDIEKLRAMAESAGAKIDFVENGMKCLDTVKGSEYDILFIPRYMPRMDGIQTIKNLNNMPMNRCYNSKVYVIISEGFEENENEEVLKAKGFTGVIRKPFGKYVFNNLLIKNSEESALPDDIELVKIIKAVAVQEEKLQIGGVLLSKGLETFGGNIKNYRRAACKFCRDFEKDSSALLRKLNEEDQNGYMNTARDLRDKVDGLGAAYLADMFDDHVNIAKEDSLEVAAMNWRNLVQKWREVTDSFEIWLGIHETGAKYEYPTGTNGILICDRDLKAMLYKALVSMDQGNITSEARDILETAADYDMSDEKRKMLYDILHNINQKKFQNVKSVTRKFVQTLSS